MRVRIWEENGARTEKAPKLWLPLRRESNCVQNGDRALDLARIKVGVGSPCDLSISVAQAAGDLLYIDPVIGEECRVGVPEVVDADMRETRGIRISDAVGAQCCCDQVRWAAADEEAGREAGHAALAGKMGLQSINKRGGDTEIADGRRGLRRGFDALLSATGGGVAAADADQAGREVDVRPAESEDLSAAHAGKESDDKKHNIVPVLQRGGGGFCGRVKAAELLRSIELEVLPWRGGRSIPREAQAAERRLTQDTKLDRPCKHRLCGDVIA